MSDRDPASCRGVLREDGTGSLLVVAVASSVLAVTMMVAPIGLILAARQSAGAAADAAALAGADVAIGIRPGAPCAEAERIADANGAALTACVVDGAVVTVRVSVMHGVLHIEGAATAGPPPGSEPADGGVGSPSEQ